jgi:integrase/recombinase XerD
MSSIFLNSRSGTWYVQWSDGGRKRQRSLDTKDAREAKRLQRLHDAAVAAGEPVDATPTIRLREALDAYRNARQSWWSSGTILGHNSKSASIVDYFGDVPVMSLSVPLVEAMAAKRASDGAGPRTVVNWLTCLRTAVRWLAATGRIPADPVRTWPRIKLRSVRPERIGGYSAAEIAAILDALRGVDVHLPVAVCAWTGCRINEALTLTRGQVDLQSCIVQIRNAKGERDADSVFRPVEIHAELAPILSAACEGKRATDALCSRRMTHQRVFRWTRVACKRLGIQWRRLHGMRWSFASRLLSAGVPVTYVQRALGHRRIEQTLRYYDYAHEQRGWIARLDSDGRTCPHCGGKI